MNKDKILYFLSQRKVYLTIGAIILLGILTIVLGMNLEEAKSTVESIWDWVQGFNL